jgi:hypothetical protein
LFGDCWVGGFYEDSPFNAKKNPNTAFFNNILNVIIKDSEAIYQRYFE